jgi:prefoldin subunit 5
VDVMQSVVLSLARTVDDLQRLRAKMEDAIAAKDQTIASLQEQLKAKE